MATTPVMAFAPSIVTRAVSTGNVMDSGLNVSPTVSVASASLRMKQLPPTGTTPVFHPAGSLRLPLAPPIQVAVGLPYMQ